MCLMTNNKDYGFIVGGVHLTENGKVIASITPVAVYSDMDGANVQTFWKWLINNQTVAAAMSQFTLVLAQELNALGDANFINKGIMTEEDLKEAEEFIEKLKKVKK